MPTLLRTRAGESVRHRRAILGAVLSALLMATPVAAQTFALRSAFISGGGGTSGDPTFTLRGVIPAIGSAVGVGGTFELAAETVSPVKSFTDNALTLNLTTVRAIHVIELRARINALRGRAALGAFAWSEPSLVAGATIVRAADIAELRTALGAVYVAAGRTAPVYTDAVITAGVPIRRAHILQLRAAIVAVE